MKGLLGKLFSVKGFLLTAAVATTIAVAPLAIKQASPEKPVPRKIGDFRYHTEVTNISAINTQSSPKQGLRQANENGVTSVGNHGTPDPNEADRSIYVDISIENAPEAITIKHSHHPKSNLSIEKKVDEHLTEDANNTHTYLILPKEIETGLFTQTIRRINTKNPEGFSVETIPTKDSKLNAAIRKYNRLFASNPNQSDPEISELEQAVRNSAKLLGGKKEKIIEFGIDGFKRVLEKNETSRRDFLKQKYGKEYQVIKAPIQASNKREAGSNPIGRTTILEIDNSKLEETKEGYIEIPQITFSRNDKRAGLQKLAYKFEIRKPKEAPFRKQLPLDKVLLGPWESIGESYHENNAARFTVNENSTIVIITPDNHPIINATASNIKDPDAHKWYNNRRTFEVITQDLVCMGKHLYKRKNAPTQNISTAKRLLGRWDEDSTKETTYEISKDHLIYTNGTKRERHTIKKPIKRIGETYIITTERKNGTERELIATQTGKNKMKLILGHNDHSLTRK